MCTLTCKESSWNSEWTQNSCLDLGTAREHRGKQNGSLEARALRSIGGDLVGWLVNIVKHDSQYILITCTTCERIQVNRKTDIYTYGHMVGQKYSQTHRKTYRQADGWLNWHKQCHTRFNRQIETNTYRQKNKKSTDRQTEWWTEVRLKIDKQLKI